MKSVSDLGELTGKRVLIRCDLNVPLDGETITDDGRIRASLPTLNELRDGGAKIIVMAHLGRPKGQFNPKYSLAPVARRLAELRGFVVREGIGTIFTEELVSPDVAEALAREETVAGNAAALGTAPVSPGGPWAPARGAEVGRTGGSHE